MMEDILVIALAAALVASIIGIIVVDKKTKEILRANKELMEESKRVSEEALRDARAKTDFVAKMSHEIRTPVNAISCATELLLQEELTPQGNSYLSIVKSSSDNLMEIVNDILDFSKMDNGKLSLIEGEYQIKDTLKDVKNILSGKLQDKNLSFTIEIDPTLPKSLVGDEVRIKQILINLLNNAIKYTVEGEVILKITYERLSKDAIDLRFTVKDTGCGITPEEKEFLNAKFATRDPLRTRFGEGPGIGLSICYQLALMMGGTISFESELGKGSTFHASMMQRVPVDACSIIEGDLSKNFSLDFLVWEDNSHYRRNMLKILSDIGIPSKAVDSYSDLEGVLATVKIDYIITTEKHFSDTVTAINKLSPTTIPVKLVEINEPADTSFDGIFATIKRPVDVFGIIEVIQAKEFVSMHTTEHTGKLSAPDAKFLVVDDNKVNLKVAKALLETFDARVVAVDSGYEAVELVRMGERFDMIFMDHMMPGMDGIETANRIIQIEGKNKTPIIALTANAGGEVEKLFFEAGLQDFIPKPIVMKHLNYVLQKWLPKDKQIFASIPQLRFSSDERLISKAFQPEWGLSKVWNDEKIFFELLHIYMERSRELISQIDEEPILSDAVAAAEDLLKLSVTAGSTKLPSLLTELINVGRMEEEGIFKAKLRKIEEENESLCMEISKYLEKEQVEDILTFM